MAYTTIDDGSAHFHTLLYTGNGSDDRNLTNDANAGDFKPDWLWIKQRSAERGHIIVDSSRGATKRIRPDSNAAEDTKADHIQAFLTNGFQVGTNNTTNVNSGTYVAWQWKANGGTTTSFSESGNNPAGAHQANTTAGFSIVTYTGTGANGTVAHGLGAKPNVMLQKKIGGDASWVVYHDKVASDPATDYLILNESSANADYAPHFNDTEPTSTVFTVGTDGAVNSDGVTNIMYCFTEIKGYSKFGSYRGNGNADGTFAYTGFKPAWIMVKRTDGSNDWIVFDSKRLGYNGDNKRLYPNQIYVEDTTGFDLLSNGFKTRMTGTTLNGSGNSYVYMAFAEHPFVSSEGVPTTAR